MCEANAYLIKDGKEKHIDLTNFAFEKAMDKEEFTSELRDKIREEFPGITIKRLYTSVEPGEIRELVDRATQVDWHPVWLFMRYRFQYALSMCHKSVTATEHAHPKPGYPFTMRSGSISTPRPGP